MACIMCMGTKYQWPKTTNIIPHSYCISLSLWFGCGSVPYPPPVEFSSMGQPSSGALLVIMAEERALKSFIPEIKCSGMEMTHYTLKSLANTSHMLPPQSEGH